MPRTFGVLGSGEFPHDALRVAKAWPASEVDAAGMGGRQRAGTTRLVLLTTEQDEVVDEFGTYGWRVVEDAAQIEALHALRSQ